MSIIVLGTDTGVGKTVTSAVILRRYVSRAPLAYWKPVQSGTAEGSDRRLVERWTGGRVETLPEVYALEEPLSPHLAARRSGVSIDPERIARCLVEHALADPSRNLVIEGIGGALVPLTDAGYLLADLCRELCLPCLVVARSTLGTINHTLLTLEALRSRRIETIGVVLSGPRNDENRKAIERFGKARVISTIRPIRPLGRAGIARAARGFDRHGALRDVLAGR